MTSEFPDDPFDGKLTEGLQSVKKKIGKYELIRPLGRGGMGEVWLARDTVADVEVAIKMLPPELRYNDEAQEQIRVSYQRVHKLGHQHICAVKDLVLDRGAGFFLVMDFFDGITLSKYRNQYVTRHGSFPIEEVVRLLKPVAEALDFAHSAGIAHRDIKPDNILVSIDGKQVRIIDFQLAAEIRATVSRFTKLQVDTSGTYPYLAPEQFRGARSTIATDQYSLAMTAYELLAGELPFETLGWEMWKAIVTDPLSAVPKIPGLSPNAQAALEASLSADPKTRALSCRAFVDALADTQVPGEVKGSEPLVRSDQQDVPKDKGPSTVHPERPAVENTNISNPVLPPVPKDIRKQSDSQNTGADNPSSNPQQIIDKPRTNSSGAKAERESSAVKTNEEELTLEIDDSSTPNLPGEKPKRRISTTAKFAIAFLIIGGVFLLLPAIQQSREAARRTQSKNNLKQLGLALHNYHDNYVCFPPGTIANSTGKTFHGWQTMLLPYMDRAPLYNQINFHIPWNESTNASLSKSTIPALQNPRIDGNKASSEGYSLTHYSANSNLMWNNSNMRIAKITDGTSNTLLGGDIGAAFPPWAAPGNFRDPTNGLSGGSQGFGTGNGGYAQMLMGDGSIRLINSNIDPKVLRRLSLPNDGEVVGDF